MRKWFHVNEFLILLFYVDTLNKKVILSQQHNKPLLILTINLNY